MKKVLAILLVLVLALGMFAGCGGGKTDAGTGVHVFYYNNADAYMSTVRTQVDKRLNDAGIKFQNHDGNNDQKTQTEQVDIALTQGAKVLVINQVTTGAADVTKAFVEKARKAGIPIIFFNREVDFEAVKSYDKAAFIGTNAPEAGHMQGEMIGDFLLKDYAKYDLNGDGKISYSMFMGENGNAEAIARTQFSVEDANKKLVAAGKPELVYYDAANTSKYKVDPNGAWSAAFGQEQMQTDLSKYNEKNKNMIEVVICNNDNMAEGVVTALNAAGYNTGNEKLIPVFGVDAIDNAVILIDAGKMAGTIKQDADGMAKAVVHLISNAVAKKDLKDGTSIYNIDKDKFAIRVPYAKYTK